MSSAAAPAADLEELLEKADAATREAVARLLQVAAARDESCASEMEIIHRALADSQGEYTYEEILALRGPDVITHHRSGPSYPLPREMPPLAASLEQVLGARASRRDYSGLPVTRRQMSALLHYAYGVKHHIRAYNRKMFPVRFAPSAGGLQPVELYLAVNAVEGLPQGVYHYTPDDHALTLVNQGDMRRVMVRCCMGQEWVYPASAILILALRPERTQWKYGMRAYRFGHMDVGFLGENLYLVATALGLRMTALAGFVEEAVNGLAGLDGSSEFTALLMALGTQPPNGDGCPRTAGDASAGGAYSSDENGRTEDNPHAEGATRARGAADTPMGKKPAP